MVKLILSGTFCCLISLPVYAAQWQTKYSSFATGFSPASARHSAERGGSEKVGPMYQLCHQFQGAANHQNWSSNNYCRLWGQEEFLCQAVTTVTCELGNIEFTAESSLEGSYLDERTGAFVHIDENRQVSMNLMAPYADGRDLKEIGAFNRTGENTYTLDATFLSAEACGTTARFDFTHLSDGTLLVQATSPERVSAIIFGVCRWEGEARAFYELKKFNFVD